MRSERPSSASECSPRARRPPGPSGHSPFRAEVRVDGMLLDGAGWRFPGKRLMLVCSRSATLFDGLH